MERQARCIDHRAVDIVHVLLKRVHQHAFGVGLRGDQLDVEFLCEVRQAPVDLVERGRAVYLWLAAAEQIEIGPVHHQDSEHGLLRLRLAH